MKAVIAVACGGALGALLRYGVGLLAWRVFGPGFSWATVSINIIGSFALGALMGYMALRGQLSPEWRTFLVIGVLGAFTTFSTFSMEAIDLLERNYISSMLLYIAVSVTGALLAFWIGMRLMRFWLS